MITLKQFDKVVKVMENCDFALAVVNSLLGKPNDWKLQAEEYCWISTAYAIEGITGESVPHSVASRVTDSITVFPRPNLSPKIYGICLTLNSFQSSAPQRLWFFVVQRTKSLEYVVAPKDTVQVNNKGDITVDYDDVDHTFRRDPPVWPWPAFNPAPFQPVAWIDQMLQPNEANPLTGLLSSSRGETRTLAAQLKNRFIMERNLLCHRAEQFALGESAEKYNDLKEK